MSDRPSRIPSVKPDNLLFVKGLGQLRGALDKLGFEAMRPGQDACVRTALAGVDCIHLLPTSAGKTGTWLLPAIAHKWKVLVFSPLLALMQDQVEGMRNKGLAAVQLSGDQNDALNNLALQRWMSGDAQIMLTAPERIGSADFDRAMRACPPDYVVVDEAHTIAQWGESFRPAFARLGSFIDAHPKIRLVTAMTATATPDVLDAIRSTLKIPAAVVNCFMAPRENLHCSYLPFPGEGPALKKIAELARLGSQIVYCVTTKDVEELHKAVESMGVTAVVFHSGGGLPD